METIASFIVFAILSVGTSKRRCEYSHAITLPFASTIVDTAGTSPSRSWADPLATTSEARLDISPTPGDQWSPQRPRAKIFACVTGQPPKTGSPCSHWLRGVYRVGTPVPEKA